MRRAVLHCVVGTSLLSAVPGLGRCQAPGGAARTFDLGAAESYLASAGDVGTFQGVVLIARGGRVVFHEAYGWADIDLDVPMRPNHVFRIGSLTKPVTASAAMIAVARGLLSLEDRVCERLPSCPSSWRGITLRNLLSHTSGLQDHFGDLESVPVDETVPELYRVLSTLDAAEGLAFDPGTEYAYTNFNYVLVGAMLESAFALPWEDVLDTLVVEPLGLHSIQYDDVYATIPGRVRGYDRGDDGVLRNIDYDDHAAYAVGGLLSDATDLFRWSRAVFRGEILPPDLVRESVTPVQGNYGYGWQVRRFFDRSVYNHTGGIDGFSSHIAIYPEEETTFVVLTNVESDSAILTACDLAGLAFGWFEGGTRSTLSELSGRQRCGLER